MFINIIIAVVVVVVLFGVRDVGVFRKKKKKKSVGEEA